ncbi:hypothetical protein GALMADRAFT_210197 [Galerina marginata CBS 339.88]|uniref:Uncharacterized protein n=1 Tax=Galerina marginata (strain CBS 339.88) TaxID=685588 RepID=A0A067T1I0_GALM3|nr:hypothetical protein GALMADRAFT_210197 [Galerina marginata CBS 339.88]
MSQKGKLSFSSTLQMRDLDEAIYVTCMGSNSQHVITGGSAGTLRVWDVSSGYLHQSIHIGAQITAISHIDIGWRREGFLVGSMDGSVALYCRTSSTYAGAWILSLFSWLPGWMRHILFSPFCLSLKTSINGQPVESLATNGKLVAAVGNQDLQIWSVGTHLIGTSVAFSLSLIPTGRSIAEGKSLHNLSDFFSELPPSTLSKKRIRSAHFLPGVSQDLLLVTLVDSHPAGRDSLLALYQVRPWKLVRASAIDRRVGLAAISTDHRTYAFTNLLNGIEIFSLPGLEHCGTILQNIRAETNVTLGVAFEGPIAHDTYRAISVRLMGASWSGIGKIYPFEQTNNNTQRDAASLLSNRLWKKAV